MEPSIVNATLNPDIYFAIPTIFALMEIIKLLIKAGHRKWNPKASLLSRDESKMLNDIYEHIKVRDNDGVPLTYRLKSETQMQEKTLELIEKITMSQEKLFSSQEKLFSSIDKVNTNQERHIQILDKIYDKVMTIQK